jgi:hypothetical protein
MSAEAGSDSLRALARGVDAIEATRPRARRRGSDVAK